MTSPLVLALGIILGAYVILSALLHLTQDAKEPPMIETSIPFVSPLFGLILGMQKFMVELGLASSTGQRIYIANSPSLIPQLQRLIKTVAFEPVEAQAAEAVMGVGPAGNAIIGSDKMLENDSYLSTFVLSTHPALAPDPGLDAISCAIARHLSDSIEKLSLTVELFSWVRGEIFRAITESTYGPKNPFRDPALEKAWLDIAVTEIGQMIASLTNSTGTAFWMVYHVFSEPIVLEECRAEAEKLVQLDDNGVQTIDLAKIRSSCPVLFSTWQEIL
ncbi:hypothetical protein RJZ56_007146 [Blastomyces dermatitidis]